MLKLFSVVKKDTTLLGKNDASLQLGRTNSERESNQGKQRWKDEIKSSLRRDLLFKSFAVEPRGSGQAPRTRIVRSTTLTGLAASPLLEDEVLGSGDVGAPAQRTAEGFQPTVTGRVVRALTTELDDALETVYSWEEGPSAIPRTLSNGQSVKVGRLKKTYSKGDGENGEAEGTEQEYRKMAADLAAKDVELDALKQRYSKANDTALKLKGENQRIIQASESADLSQLISTIHSLEESLSNKEKETVNMRQRLAAIEKQLEVSQEEKEKVVKELMGDAAAAATELSDLREAHAAKHQELTRKEEQVESMRLQLQAAEDSVAFLLHEKRKAEGTSERLAESQAPLASELNKARGENEELKSKLQELEALVAQREKKLQEMESLLAQKDSKAQEVEVLVAQKGQALEQEKFSLEYARKALQGEVESLKEKCASLERLHQSAAKNEAALAKEVETLKQEAAEQRQRQEAKDQEEAAQAATLAALQSEVARKSEELAAAHREIEKHQAQAAGVESSVVAELKADVSAKEKQLKVFQDRLKGVEEALMSLGYEREGGAKPGQAGASGPPSTPGAASSGETDVEKAGKWVIKHCLSIEALKKEHELERKLSRREILNLQQEVEELRAAKATKDKEATELRERLASATSSAAAGVLTSPRWSASERPREAEASAVAATPRKQMAATMEKPSPMSVNRGAGERVKARAMELMKQTSISGQSSSAEGEKQEGPGGPAALQPEATPSPLGPTEPAQSSGSPSQEPGAGASASSRSTGNAAANGEEAQVEVAEQQTGHDAGALKPVVVAATGVGGGNSKNKKKNKGRGKH